MPSLFSPWSDQDKKTSEAVSEILGASATQKRSKGFSFLGERKDSVDAVDGKLWEEGNAISNATSAENMPTNFEAMSHTCNIALLSTRSKASSHMALVRCFQLALSLRSISLAQEVSIRGDSSLYLLGVSQIMPAAALTDDDTFTELNGSQSGRRTSISVILSEEWLWNVLKIANLGKFKKKMSILHSFKHQAEAKVFPIEEEKKDTSVHDVNTVASVLRFGGSDDKIETKLSLKIATPRRTVTVTPIFDVVVITIIVFTIIPEVLDIRKFPESCFTQRFPVWLDGSASQPSSTVEKRYGENGWSSSPLFSYL
ncbi:hypothetical protein D5086_030109 [Populus alba]|uniref:Uncharacterized protein n=1 Tax=Populus alba TaxID=43335 RepID=A0ACC4AMN4_POPAL